MRHNRKQPPTAHEIRVDVAKQMNYLEMANPNIANRTKRPLEIDPETYGRYLALKELQWRLDNPDYLGKVMA